MRVLRARNVRRSLGFTSSKFLDVATSTTECTRGQAGKYFHEALKRLHLPKDGSVPLHQLAYPLALAEVLRIRVATSM